MEAINVKEDSGDGFHWKDYIYNPEDDIGFNRIYFYLENDNINKIEVINGIAG